MIGIVDFIVSLPALVFLVLAGFFLLEVVGSLFAARKPAKVVGERGPVCVIIPAHNEGEGVRATIADVLAQVTPADRLIVVADNCTDNTADIAREAGAEVLERKDDTRRGKGYALQFALDAIRHNPPTAVFFVDADCRLGANAIDKTVGVALATGRPAQALYLMRAPSDAALRMRVSEFAWRLMNDVRMRGLFRLFDTTRLTGAGMALPWALAQDLQIGSGEIVEDLALALELTRNGAAPIMAADALITSEFPTEETAAATQRARWEHGSLSLAKRLLGVLFLTSFAKRDGRLAAMALDLAIPPMTVFGALLALAWVAAGALALVGLKTAFALMTIAAILFGVGLIVAWARIGREILPLSALVGVFGYLFSKGQVYGKDARQSTKTWTRTGRAGDALRRDEE